MSNNNGVLLLFELESCKTLRNTSMTITLKLIQKHSEFNIYIPGYLSAIYIYLLYLASARSRLLYIITLKNTWKTHTYHKIRNEFRIILMYLEGIYTVT